jgi:hypothetical protein
MELALLERPLDSFPAFHGTQRFSTEFTRALHLFLSLARPIQSTLELYRCGKLTSFFIWVYSYKKGS